MLLDPNYPPLIPDSEVHRFDILCTGKYRNNKNILDSRFRTHVKPRSSTLTFVRSEHLGPSISGSSSCRDFAVERIQVLRGRYAFCAIRIAAFCPVPLYQGQPDPRTI